MTMSPLAGPSGKGHWTSVTVDIYMNGFVLYMNGIYWVNSNGGAIDRRMSQNCAEDHERPLYRRL